MDRQLIRISLFIAIALAAAGIGFTIYYETAFSARDLSPYLTDSDPAPICRVRDVDHDGSDELFLVDTEQYPRYVKWVDHAFNPIHQINFTQQKVRHELSFVDIDHDGIKEIGVGYQENGSFTIEFFDCAADGCDRTRSIHLPGGEICDTAMGWDGHYRIIATMDVNDDSIPDLLLHVHTNQCFQPRGIVAYDLTGDTLIWTYFVGAALSEPRLADVDGDGEEEIVASSLAFANGPPEGVGGLDDYHSYLLVLSKEGRLERRLEIGGYFSQSFALARPYSDDETANLFITVTPSTIPSSDEYEAPGHADGQLLALNGRTGDTLARRTLDYKTVGHQMTIHEAANHLDKLGIVTFSPDGRLRRYSPTLDLIAVSDPYSQVTLRGFCDLEQDGSPEILISSAYGRRAILRSDFSEVAYYSSGQPSDAGIEVTVAPDGRKQLILHGTRVAAASIPPLPGIFAARLYEYGWIAFAPLGVILVLLMAGLLQRNRSAARLIATSERPDGTGLLLIGGQERVLFSDRRVRLLLGLRPSRLRRTLERQSEQQNVNILLSHIGAVRQGEVEASKDILHLSFSGKPRFVRMERAATGRTLLGAIELFEVSQPSELSYNQLMVQWFKQASAQAHDLKAPLSRALDSLELVERSSAVEQPELLRVAERDIRESQVGIDRFLKIDLREPGFEMLGIKEEVDYVLCEQADLAGPNITIRAEVTENCPAVLADQEMFRRILRILITNARVHGVPGGGIIRVNAERIAGESRHGVAVSVSDDGAGMSSAAVAHATDLHYSTEQKRGSGLGLAIVRYYCDLHGAILTINSAPGQGTRGTITFRVGVSDG